MRTPVFLQPKEISMFPSVFLSSSCSLPPPQYLIYLLALLHLPCLPLLFSLIIIVPLYFFSEFSENPMSLFSNFLFQFSALILKPPWRIFVWKSSFSSPRLLSVHRLFLLPSHRPSFHQCIVSQISFRIQSSVWGVYFCIIIILSFLLLLVLFHG